MISRSVSETAETSVTVFKSNDFTELVKIAEGGEAVVYSAESEEHGKVCLKVFVRPTVKNSAQEIKTLSKLSCHQNIVRFLGSFRSEDDLCLVRFGYAMEFMNNGSLSDVIHNPTINYDNHQVYSWILQASRGIIYLHSNNVLHRDLNTRNMLLGDTRSVLKISDFGMAKQNAVSQSQTYFIGTVGYMAPEMIKDGSVEYNTAVDVYSFAISAWEMFHRKKPFYEHAGLTHFHLSTEIIAGLRPTIQGELEEDMKILIKNSWNKDPKKRSMILEFLRTAATAIKRPQNRRDILVSASVALEDKPIMTQASEAPLLEVVTAVPGLSQLELGAGRVKEEKDTRNTIKSEISPSSERVRVIGSNLQGITDNIGDRLIVHVSQFRSQETNAKEEANVGGRLNDSDTYRASDSNTSEPLATGFSGQSSIPSLGFFNGINRNATEGRGGFRSGHFGPSFVAAGGLVSSNGRSNGFGFSYGSGGFSNVVQDVEAVPLEPSVPFYISQRYKPFFQRPKKTDRVWLLSVPKNNAGIVIGRNFVHVNNYCYDQNVYVRIISLSYSDTTVFKIDGTNAPFQNVYFVIMDIWKRLASNKACHQQHLDDVLAQHVDSLMLDEFQLMLIMENYQVYMRKKGPSWKIRAFYKDQIQQTIKFLRSITQFPRDSYDLPGLVQPNKY